MSYFFRSLAFHRSFTLLFVLNMSFGLLGFTSILSFRHAFESSLAARSKQLLGADLSLSARRPLLEEEEQLVAKELGRQAPVARTIETFSMVAAGEQARLMQLFVADSNFPFYGKYEFEEWLSEASLGEYVWVYPEVLLQLEIELGDLIRVGEAEFKVGGAIKPATGQIASTMAPRVILSHEQFEKTKLLQPGSVAFHSRLYHLPEISDLSGLKERLFAKAQEADLRIETHGESSAMLARMNNYLNDFLGLTSLAALFLTAIGGAYLFRAHLHNRLKEIAILLSLGMSRNKALFRVCSELVILGLVSSLIALTCSWALAPLVEALVAELLPIEIVWGLNPITIALALILGAGSGLLFGLPFIGMIRRLKPAELFRDQKMSVETSGRVETLLWSLVPLAVFWGLSVWQSHSLRTGSLFFVAVIVVSLILAGFAFVLLKLIPSKFGLAWFWAIRDLRRFRWASLSAFLALSLGMVLMNLIPQIQASLDLELQSPEESKLPSLFLFDIQSHQIEELKSITESYGGLKSTTPMVRAQLSTVNGESFEKGSASGKLTREQENEMRFRNRGFNLTYRSKLSESEDLVMGREFSDEVGEIAEISVEQNFASRLGFRLGDRLVFDVHGLPIEAEIVNLRRVRWTSFQPNFFVVFQPGVLEMAPKNFLATLGPLDAEKKVQVQKDVTSTLSNISMINVSRVVETLSRIIDQMAFALRALSILCLVAGLFVIFAITSHQATARKWDVGLLKALGASWSLIRKSFLYQNLVLAFLAGGLGCVVSLGLSYVLSLLLFEGVWAVNLAVPLGAWALLMVVIFVITQLAVRSSLRTKASDLLS